MDMQQEIAARLNRIEEERSVRIIFAAESGSRSWGLASPDSDYDVRFIYVKPLPQYLRINEGADFIEWQLDAVYDINGWDLKKALGQLYKGNASLFEWRHSPMIYRTTPEWETVSKVFEGYFSEKALVRHYYGLAKSTFMNHLQGDNLSYKKYFYALRPLLSARHIEILHEFPPLVFTELLERDQALPRELRDAVSGILDIKKQIAEKDLRPRIPVISAFIEAELEAQQEMLAALPDDRQRDYDALNQVFQEIVFSFK